MTAAQLIARAAECQTCGKEHKPHKDPSRPNLASQWSDLEDGHPYRSRLPVSTVEQLRQLAASR
jgi:hypothetical protein